MKSLKRLSLSFVLLLLFSGVSLALPPAARGQSGAATDSSDTTTAQAESRGMSLAEQFRAQAKARMQAARENSKNRTEAQRQRACTARKAALTRRMNNAVSQANKHKAVFDKIYTRVKDFYTTKNLNVADYDTLTTTANNAQTNAQASIDALQSLNIAPDCSSETVADGVSAFQAAVKSTRDSLKSYRTALVDLINSLKGASTEASTTPTNGSNQ